MNTIFYKFMHANKFDAIKIGQKFISCFELKQLLSQRLKLDVKQHKGRGKDCALVILNAQTKEEYKNDDIIMANSCVLLQRVPSYMSQESDYTSNVTVLDTIKNDVSVSNTSRSSQHSFASKIPGLTLGNQNVTIEESKKKEEDNRTEEEKLNALLNNSYMDYMPSNKMYIKKSEPKTQPPFGYICHRCGKPGHFIKNCPTNGDPAFDIKKRAYGIPSSSLQVTKDPSKASVITANGQYAVLKPDEETFEKIIRSKVNNSFHSNKEKRRNLKKRSRDFAFGNFYESSKRQKMEQLAM